ncbi:MAG: peptide-methionine (S)-S-oxide reductase MsrA [Pseudomonadales bacterium]|nr:peptide-methionine (S)-S-oxide reductase MsrA [Pseudomonadales bacterium]
MLFGLTNKPLELPTKETALPDRAEPLRFKREHFVNGNPISAPVPEHLASAVFGLGCFWGAERLFWQIPGVFSTAVGYAGGITVNPTYEDVCSGMTGHTEVVLVYFDPGACSYEDLLTVFWESHNPTQGMQQGNDRGTQYRSAIYTSTEQQLLAANNSKSKFQSALTEKGYSGITTEVSQLDEFYYAEDYHQQYLAKNPKGYCGIAGTGACYHAE